MGHGSANEIPLIFGLKYILRNYINLINMKDDGYDSNFTLTFSFRVQLQTPTFNFQLQLQFQPLTSTSNLNKKL